MDTVSLLALLGFVAAAALAASSGVVFRPGDWYRTLRQPAWTPPRWVFPLVWTPLYGMIALSGWLAWSVAGIATVPFALYGIQLALNAGWSAIFFGLHRPDLAFAELALLWLSLAATIAAFVPLSTTAAWLLAPYLVWVTIAGGLNLSVWRLNARRVARA